GSKYSQRGMEKGRELANAFGANIILVNVKTWAPVSKYTQGELSQLSMEQYQSIKEGVEEYNRRLLEDSRKLLENARKYFQDIEGEVIIQTLEGDAGSAIIDYTEENENDIDLIIIGSKGVNAGKVKGLFIGSVANKVISGTRLPILVIK